MKTHLGSSPYVVTPPPSQAHTPTPAASHWKGPELQLPRNYMVKSARSVPDAFIVIGGFVSTAVTHNGQTINGV